MLLGGRGGEVYWFVGGVQWTAGPCLSTPDFVWTVNDRQGEGKTEARVGEKKRERDGLCQGLLMA